MEKYFNIVKDAFVGYFNYLAAEITTISWHNYFYALVFISLAVYILELVFPWRKDQPRLRRDFWLDGFYMFFNFFIFYLIGYNAVAKVAVQGFNDLLALFDIRNMAAVSVAALPKPVQLLLMFVLRDFIQYWVHRLLHKYPTLWRFHQVHHSVKQMGFAAHLRFHFIETVVYRTIEFIPLGMIGFGIEDFFIVHILALTVGHLGHANLYIPLGPFKYVFNNPQLHIWHHSKTIPPGTYGINFCINLSMWDYLFKTAHLPYDGRDIEIGFDDDEKYPNTFLSQTLYPFRKQASP